MGTEGKPMGSAAHLYFFVLLSFIRLCPAFAQIEAVSQRTRAGSENCQSPGLSRPFPWKTNIVRTCFGSAKSQVEIISSRIAQVPGINNGRKPRWFDHPNPAHGLNYVPTKVIPQQNPYYCNPLQRQSTYWPPARSASCFSVVSRGVSRAGCFHLQGPMDGDPKGNRIALAQWENAVPFRTDHWQYVFGNERPKPNLNQGAGLDVSPAVPDCLGLSKQTSRTGGS